MLSTLVQEIKAGKRKWSDVVPLEVHSVPSGQMQDWPIGSPVTLHTLATMMISISDNTATDALIRVLGREAVAAEMVASGHAEPSRNIPMLTTVEFFALKSGDPARIAALRRRRRCRPGRAAEANGRPPLPPRISIRHEASRARPPSTRSNGSPLPNDIARILTPAARQRRPHRAGHPLGQHAA